MNFLELIAKRESSRDYADKPVAKELIEKCLEAARIAPSACNSQPWKFIVATEKETINNIKKAVQRDGRNKFTQEVPAFIVIEEQAANLRKKLGNLVKNQQYAQIDTGIVAAYITLAAADMGLSTCILGWFDEDKVKEACSIAKSKRVRLVICVGYAATDKIRNKVRKDMEKLVEYK